MKEQDLNMSLIAIGEQKGSPKPENQKYAVTFSLEMVTKKDLWSIG